MASHDVALKVATELPVGAVDLEIPVKRNGRRIGTFTVNANGVSWNPATAKAATNVTWEDLPAALAGTATASAAAPAKKASAPAQKAATPAQKTTASAQKASAPAQKAATPAQKTTAPAQKAATPAKKTTAKKAAGKKAAPAPTPAPAPAEETPAPAAPESPAPAASPAKKTTAKKTAKKSAPSTAAVDARAVREWAATQGITVAPRGPISSTIIDQFRAAQ